MIDPSAVPKRKGDDEQDDDLGSKRAKTDPEGKEDGKEIAIRVLLERAEVGSLIGKAGANIKEFRETTGTQIDISQASDGVKDRIATIRGSYWRVVGALQWMANTIVNRKKDRQPLAAAGSPEKYSLTLLMFNSWVGAIIGRGGTVIKELREATKADIKISKTVMEGSNEKSIRIEGARDAFDKAIEVIVKHAYEANDGAGRGGSLYQPRPPPQQPQQMPLPYNPYQGMMGGFGELGGGLGGAGVPGLGSYGGIYDRLEPPPAAPVPDPVGQRESVVIQVPESHVGAVIGRGGATINEIRSRSGADVKVEKRVPNATKRTVTVSGSKQATEIATAYISHLINQAARTGS